MKQFSLKTLSLLLFSFVSYIGHGYAQPEIDGVGIISSPGTIVNEYTYLTSDAKTGDTSIKVGSSSLNTHSRFSGNLEPGDLVMIIQMEGATINGLVDDSTWGAITSYNNCGNYELFQVRDVPNSTTIGVACLLKNNYTAAGRVQIVRIPRYQVLIVDAGATLTGDAWNGTQGGVVAVEVYDYTLINPTGAIDASGLGFRGGVMQNSLNVFPDIRQFAETAVDSGNNKGEGIAGYQSEYNKYGGMYGRGAPANGGGGGNSINAGGGGGSNAGNIKAYTGNGTPDTSTAAWKAAWNLEYKGFANSNSSGGGRGGYSWSNTNGGDPLILGPGNSLWRGDDRNNLGGKGGRPLDYAQGKIFMGGGGGAGHSNDFGGGGGGNGGGIIFIASYDSVTGGGSIISNGANGGDNNASTTNVGDAPGGAGAGGTVIVTARYGVNGVSINTNGGNGGNQMINTLEAEGAGAGGGGGYIAIYKGNPTRLAAGGVNGTTNSFSLKNFPPNGATKGGAGIANAYITPFYAGISNQGTTTPVSICPMGYISLAIIPRHDGQLPTDTLYVDSSYTYLWSPSTYSEGSLTDSVIIVNPPVGEIDYIATISTGICATKDTFAITVNPIPTLNPRLLDSICQGSSVTLIPTGDSSTYSFFWHPSNGLSCTNCRTPIANPAINSNYEVVVTNQFGCKDSVTERIRIVPPPTISFNNNIFCLGQTAPVSVNANGNTLVWSPGAYLSCTSCNVPQVTLLKDTTYFIKITDPFGCTATDTFHAILDKPVVYAGSDTTIVQTTSGILHAGGSKNYLWQPSANLVTPDSAKTVATPTVTTTYTVTGTDSLGCQAKASVIIFIESPCALPVLPNAFSPNGNGKNDIYRILNPYVDKLVTFSIYNRWGELVFQTDDLSTGWDGTYKGKPQPVDVYEYYLKVICHGQPQAYKGNVTLLR